MEAVENDITKKNPSSNYTFIQDTYKKQSKTHYKPNNEFVVLGDQYTLESIFLGSWLIDSQYCRT